MGGVCFVSHDILRDEILCSESVLCFMMFDAFQRMLHKVIFCGKRIKLEVIVYKYLPVVNKFFVIFSFYTRKV